jgi:CRP-like cAMP-binding protein
VGASARLASLTERLEGDLRPAQSLIIAQDEPDDTLYFIASGQVRVFVSHESAVRGRERRQRCDHQRGHSP